MSSSGKLSNLLSFVALLVSVVSAGATAFLSVLQNRTSVVPVLVFVYGPETGWELRNVGNGPALDIVVSHANRDSNDWLRPTLIYPLEGDGEGLARLEWVGDPEKITAYYYDAVGWQYTSTVQNDRTVVSINYFIAKTPWNPREVKRIWERRLEVR